jgi:SAM-dependent methyltransferase
VIDKPSSNSNSNSASACLAAYDAWAATYDSIDNPLIAAATVALDARASWFSGARVLELGCGTARNAAACLAAGATRYVGIDASPNMLAVARSRFTADERVAFLEADLAAATTRDSLAHGPRFDLVLICLVLEHAAAVAPIFAAAATVLAPGGHLLIVELHPALHALGIGANFRLGDREVRLPSFRHPAAELESAMAQAGLQPLATVEHIPSPAALARSPKLARYATQPVLLELTAVLKV